MDQESIERVQRIRSDCASISAVLFPTAQRREIGRLPNFQHGITGTLYAEGDCAFVIENFSYDGLGPTVFVYVYEKGATVSSSGGGLVLRLPGASG